MPKISVIIPVYKVELYIHRCVDSILNQTYTDFELILVNDGSPDNCGAICDEYAKKDGRIHVIHQENGGLSAARNAGLDWIFENSESEWVTFVDSDDWVHPSCLELLLKVAKESKNKISMCHFIRQKEKNLEFPSVQGTWRYMPTNDAYIMDAKDGGVESYAVGRLYYKELFSEVRYPVGLYWEDLYTTYKVLYLCEQIAVLDDILYYYFVNPDGVTESSWSKRNLDIIGGYKENQEFFRRRNDEKMELQIVNALRCELPTQYFSLQKSDLPTNEKKVIKRILLREMRQLLRMYTKRLGITLETDWNLYYCIFEPIFTIYEKCTFLRKPYRFLRSIFGKKSGVNSYANH